MAFSADDWADCPQRKHNPAHKSYGANLPYYAQGAVFPGDEACHTCRLTGELCEERPDVETCPLVEEPRLLPCPFCGEEVKIAMRYFLGRYEGNPLETYAECHKCGMRGPYAKANSSSKSRLQAAQDWNRVVGAKA